MVDSSESSSSLNEYQVELLNRARALKPTAPPESWGNKIIVGAAGVLAAGWDQSENILLISADGYSLTNPSAGARLIRNRDSEKTFASILPGNLHFRTIETQEITPVFGVWGGDGIHMTEDGWTLLMFIPGGRKKLFSLNGYLYPVLDEPDYWITPLLSNWKDWTDGSNVGFRHQGKYFAIVGSAGAEIFSR